RTGTRATIAGARIGKYADAGCGREPRRKIAPQSDAAETFVEHHDGGGLIRPWADHAVFELRAGNVEKAGVGEGCTHRPLPARENPSGRDVSRSSRPSSSRPW